MKITLMLCSLLLMTTLRSQKLDEWFKQKQTKLKYIVEQIVAFEMYAGYIKKGYAIVDKGWDAVGTIKQGDLEQHQNYFESLNDVKKSLASSGKINAITKLQYQILQIDNKTKDFIEENGNIHVKEKDYIISVLNNLLKGCVEDLNELKQVTTSDSLSMTDDQRLERIDNIYNDMQEKYGFARYFDNTVQTLALLRTKGLNDVNTTKLLYAIK